MALLHRVVLLILLGAAALTGADEGWQPLFDGTSLAGWRASENASSWRVDNGALVASGARSHLYYVGTSKEATFKNFELEAEVMTRPGANSGIYFHSAFRPSDWPATGLEVQINNTHVGEGEYRERRKTGSLYGIRNVYGQVVRDNEWFRLNITVRGKQVRVQVNDQLMVDYTEPTPPAVEGEYKDRVLSAGTFALQAHDPHSTVLFRKIRARRLPDNVQATAAAPVVDNTYRELLRLSGANFPVVDYHTHLKETLTLDDVLRRWRDQGIYAGVAVNGGLGFPVSSDAGLEPFLREMRGKPVFLAFQAEGREWVNLFSRKALEQFDYVFTDSMTWTDDSGKRMRLWIDREVGTIADPQHFMATLVDRTVTIINTEPIDIYVNPTFLPNQLAAQYDELWSVQRMERVVSALRANGVAMEINSRYRIPSAAFVKRARDAGVKFACGTNNSGAEDLGRMAYCIEMIRECALTWRDMWVPPADGQKAIQRKPLPVTSSGGAPMSHLRRDITRN
jgi:hypothetical protein